MMNDENNTDVEIVTKNYEDFETLYSERKKRSRERGPDKKPRTYRANSMSNLMQFREKPEEFTRYLKDEKGVNTTGNFGIVKIILIFLGLMIAVLGGWWLYNYYKSEKDSSIKNQY